MDITVTFGGGLKVNAQFKNFIVNTDQVKLAGGDDAFPDSFSYLSQ